MKVVAIIQARMGSTRLPGKILKEVLGKPLLEYQLERVQGADLLDDIIVATTTNKEDDAVAALCDSLGVRTYRGSETDVLARYYEAAVEVDADVIVRLTSDCPLIDPAIIDQVIQLYIDKRPVDYVANTLKRTFPRGLDTEVFTYEVLEDAYYEATLERDRKHVTAYFYTNPERYTFANLTSDENYSHHRWTVDTVEDFELIKRILEEIYPKKEQFTLHDIIEVLDEHPSWVSLNAHVEQKKL